ncbi:MAG: hypothetical protein AAFQ77_03025 [Myxococcota bacterium]
MIGEDEEETEQLRRTLLEAKEYLISHQWCRHILGEYFGAGVGGVFGLFLFHLEPRGDEDTWLWVIAGDLPSAYFVVDDSNSPREAMTTYDQLMRDWIGAIRDGRSLDECFPVDVSPDAQHAAMLETRLNFLRDRVLPQL